MEDCGHCGDYSAKKGAEAEDLRRVIEDLIKNADFDDRGDLCVYVEDLQKVLDEVDARDSLQFLLEHDAG